MSFADFKMGQLWGSFMPRRKEILNTVTTDLISMTIYPPEYFMNFNAAQTFEKWAAIEVKNFDHIPNEMKSFILPEGLYAVFPYKGLNTDTSIFDYILNQWLPHSSYDLDNRPHFEILGEKYKNNDPSSEEEICIPIKLKYFVSSTPGSV